VGSEVGLVVDAEGDTEARGEDAAGAAGDDETGTGGDDDDGDAPGRPSLHAGASSGSSASSAGSRRVRLMRQR
jgi:hypothetical protein